MLETHRSTPRARAKPAIGHAKACAFLRGHHVSMSEDKQSPGHISEAAATPQSRRSRSRPATKAGGTLGLSAARAGLIFSPPPTCAASAKRQHKMHLRGAGGEAAQSWLESASELCSLVSSAGDAGPALYPASFHQSHHRCAGSQAMASTEIMWARARKCWGGAQ